MAHSWPGNVREMENALESAVALSPDGSIDVSLLPGGGGAPRGRESVLPDEGGATVAGLRDRVAAYERGAIVAALESAHGNQSEAARLLDIGRATLQDKMRKYGLMKGEGSNA
jgi:two-component system response regulator HydG